MSLRDFLILVGICLIWATNNVVSKIVVSDWQVPPLLYAAIRFAIVAAITLPWLPQAEGIAYSRDGKQLYIGSEQAPTPVIRYDRLQP